MDSKGPETYIEIDNDEFDEEDYMNPEVMSPSKSNNNNNNRFSQPVANPSNKTDFARQLGQHFGVVPGKQQLMRVQQKVQEFYIDESEDNNNNNSNNSRAAKTKSLVSPSTPTSNQFNQDYDNEYSNGDDLITSNNSNNINNRFNNTDRRPSQALDFATELKMRVGRKDSLKNTTTTPQPQVQNVNTKQLIVPQPINRTANQVPQPPKAAPPQPPRTNPPPLPSREPVNVPTIDLYADIGDEEPMNELGLPYYFPDYGREQAESLLRQLQNGAFLIRKSTNKSDTQPYSLSVVLNKKVYHLEIRQPRPNKFVLGKPKPNETLFDSIDEMIGHYQSNSLHIINIGNVFLRIDDKITSANSSFAN